MRKENTKKIKLRKITGKLQVTVRTYKKKKNRFQRNKTLENLKRRSHPCNSNVSVDYHQQSNK